MSKEDGPNQGGSQLDSASTGEREVETKDFSAVTSNGNRGTAWILSVVVLALAGAQSVAGLLMPGIYRDNELVAAGWLGNDLVTLAVAVPALALSLWLVRRGSLRARLVWLGLLDYMLYNYAFYLFAAAFNAFFLLYVALFALSILALIFGLVDTDVYAIERGRRPAARDRWISLFMLVVAAGLTAVYLTDSIAFISSGRPPEIIVRTGHPTSVVFALDLSLVVPYFILGAVWLWRRRAWGYLLAAIMNVKGAIYMLALAAATISAFRAGAAAGVAELGVWIPIGAGCLLSALLLLNNLERTGKGPRRATTGK